MAEQKEVDRLTGTETTGHEWDGIKELNTPLPRWWLYVFYATILFSVVWVILYPAWPIGLSDYTKGVIGYSARADLMRDLEAQRAERAVWRERFEAQEVAEIARDPDLLQFAMAGGRVLFADNCAPCHGSGGAGAPGFPNLVDDNWMWGGSLEQIHHTVVYGVRNEHPEARISEMPAYGTLGILERDEIAAVADHVLHLAGRGEDDPRGREIFAAECAACHGEDGKGMVELGAPNLTNDIWLFGGSRQDIIAQIRQPRHGVMPYWFERLGEAELKQVTIYVHALGGGQ